MRKIKMRILNGSLLLFAASWMITGCNGSGGATSDATSVIGVDPGIETDGSGWVTADNIYVADTENNVIRVVDRTTNIISAFAGSGIEGSSPNGTTYDSVNMYFPVGLQHLTGSAVIFTNTEEGCVQKLADGVVTTVAGQCGLEGPAAGDGGLATAATMADPAGLCFDPAGNLYVADFGNNLIRKISGTTGIISTFAGSGMNGYDATLDGGSALLAPLDPTKCAFDSAGNLFVTNFTHAVIQKITPAGIISTIAGNGTSGSTGDGGLATDALLSRPAGIAIDKDSNNLYFADNGNDALRRIDLTTGIINTFAGEITIGGGSGDGGAATSALLTDPDGVAVFNGEVYVAVGYNGDHRIRKIDALGNISTVIGDGVNGNSGNGGQANAAEIGEAFSFFYFWHAL